jgi:Phytanoyl-CoA dioxygenase (PhyH)
MKIATTRVRTAVITICGMLGLIRLQFSHRRDPRAPWPPLNWPTSRLHSKGGFEANACSHQQSDCGKLVAVLNCLQTVEEDGFAIIPECLAEEVVERLRSDLGEKKYAQRNLLCVPTVRELAVSKAVKELISPILGEGCFAVRGILFNKTPDSNWKVVWHQDRTIAVRERKDVPYFGPWSTKAGVTHVQPPVSVVGTMLAIRLHLDESNEDNGPLRVIPGAHKTGCLSAEQIALCKQGTSFVCTVREGGAILMRPLLVHASSRSLKPEPRRVIHLEFAADDLPDGLEWHERV